jgi:hypothetical protein
VQVQVPGTSGRPLDPVNITFTGLNGGTGSATFEVDADGYVSASPWTLSAIVGTQSVVARVVNLTSVSTTFTAQAITP